MENYREFLVENVQHFPSGYGFHIRNQKHEPLFSVMFRTEGEAETARDAIAAALAPAIELNTFIRLSQRP